MKHKPYSAKYLDLFTQINAGAVVLTPNRRLSADLLTKYSNYQHQSKQAWPTPTIMPIDAWLNYCWNLDMLSTPKPQILSNEQELCLWEHIIEKNVLADVLFNYFETAILAKDTNALINQWNIPLAELDQNYSHDCQQFLTWQLEFNQHIHTHDLLPQSSLSHYLIQNIQNKLITLPQNIIFAFFDEYIPSIQSLRQELQQHCNISEFDDTENAGDCYQYIAKNTPQELVDLVCWAKEQYLAGKSSIACVVTDLSIKRENLEKVAKEYLHHQDKPIPYDISAGKSLTEYKIISDVFKLLSISDNLEIFLISEIIRSPFIVGASSEKAARLLLIHTIESFGILEIKLEHILSLAQNSDASYHCPILAATLEKIQHLKTSLSNHSPSGWTQQFTMLLNELGWPGEEIINSEEYQAYKKFEQVLTRFLALDHVMDSISFNIALSMLKKLTQNTEFQIQSPKTPIL